MGALERVNAALAETRVIGSVPWRPWDSPYVPFDVGGPARRSRTGLTGADGALSLQPVYSCVRWIAESVGKTPVTQYRDIDGKKTKMPPGQLVSKPSAYLRPWA